MTRVESIIGLHPDLSVEEYHADTLCPEVSLSSSGIRTLLNETPAHFAARNPRLTQWPDYARPSTDEQDLGSIVHAMVLGKGAKFKSLDLASFKNKDGSPAQTFNNAEAKAAKRKAEEDGFIVIDSDTHNRAEAIAEAATHELKARFGTWPIGQSEVAMIWQRKSTSGPIWCRALADHLCVSAGTIIDLKTTGKSISEDDLQKKIANDGADIQAAFYAEGLSIIKPELAGSVRFLFLFVEVEPPYQARPVLLTENWMTRARFRIDRAADIFGKCVRANEWPGYPVDVLKLNPPAYLENKWTNDELEAAV